MYDQKSMSLFLAMGLRKAIIEILSVPTSILEKETLKPTPDALNLYKELASVAELVLKHGTPLDGGANLKDFATTLAALHALHRRDEELQRSPDGRLAQEHEDVQREIQTLELHAAPIENFNAKLDTQLAETPMKSYVP